MTRLIENLGWSKIHKRLPTLLPYLIDNINVDKFYEIQFNGLRSDMWYFAGAVASSPLAQQNNIQTALPNFEDPTSLEGALISSRNFSLLRTAGSSNGSLLSNNFAGQGLFGGEQRGNVSALNNFASMVYHPANAARLVGLLKGKWAPNLSKEFAIAKFDTVPEAIDIANGIITTFGYELNTSYPIVMANSVYSDDLFQTAIEGTVPPDAYNAVTARNSIPNATLLKLAGPGVKWVSVTVPVATSVAQAASWGLAPSYHVDNASATAVTAMAQFKITSAGTSVKVLMIPVKDDCLPKVASLIVVPKSLVVTGTDNPSSFVRFQDVPDRRYITTDVGFSYDEAYVGELKAILLNWKGENFSLSDLPATNWNDGNTNVLVERRGLNLWPILTPPGDLTQHLQGGIGQITERSVSWDTPNGGVKNVTVITINFNVSREAVEFKKQWYLNYYAKGFGLYTPRAPGVRAKIVKEWEALPWTSLCMFRSEKTYNLSRADVANLDVAREYKRVAEKACRTNDFMAQSYNGKLTYGQVADLIESRSPMSTFYCVKHSTKPGVITEVDGSAYSITGPVVNQVVTVTDANGVATQRRIDGEENLGFLASLVVSGAILINVTRLELGFTPEMLAEEDTMKFEMDETRNLLAWSNDSRLSGLHPSRFFNADWNNLSKSGFPVVDQLNPKEVTLVAMLTASSLATMGDRLMKIRDDFTTTAILGKIV